MEKGSHLTSKRKSSFSGAFFDRRLAYLANATSAVQVLNFQVRDGDDNEKVMSFVTNRRRISQKIGSLGKYMYLRSVKT